MRVGLVNTDDESEYAFAVSQEIKAINIPIKPILNIIPLDQNFRFNLSNIVKDSESDGFSDLTKLRLFLNGGSIHMESRTLRACDFDLYSTLDSPFGNLENGTKYEICVEIFNRLGKTSISDTVIFKPTKIIAKVDKILALSEATADTILNFDNSTTPSGKIILYFSSPSNFNCFSNTKNKATHFYVKKQLMKKIRDDSWVVDTDSPESILSFDASSNKYLLPSALTINTVPYNWVVEFTPSTSDMGKVFKYAVYFENKNGLSEPSKWSGNAIHFKYPSDSDFSVVSGDKKAVLTLNEIGNANFGEYIFTDDDASPDFLYNLGNGDQRFHVDKKNKNKYETYEITGLTNGQLYSLTIETVTKDPFAPCWLQENEFLSPGQKLSIFPFTKPQVNIPVTVNAVDLDTRKPIMIHEQNALEITFVPLSNMNSLGGLEDQKDFKITQHLRYKLLQNNVEVLKPIYQPANTTDVVLKFVRESPLGTVSAYNVMIEIFNLVTQEWVQGTNSADAVSEYSRDFIPAPTAIIFTRDPLASKVKLSFDCAPESTPSGIMGNLTSSVKYRIIQRRLDTGFVSDLGTENWSRTKVEKSITGLSEGVDYLFAVVPEFSYKNIIVRKHFVTGFYTAAARALTPTFDVKAADKSFVLTWETPVTPDLKGAILDSYDIFAAKVLPNETFSPATQNKIARIETLPEKFLIEKVFASVANGVNNVLPLVDIKNDTDKVAISIATRTKVGGKDIDSMVGNSFVQKLTGVAEGKGNDITIKYPNTVTVEFIDGERALQKEPYALSAPPMPKRLSATSDSSIITVSFLKDILASEIVIFEDGEEILNSVSYVLSGATGLSRLVEVPAILASDNQTFELKDSKYVFSFVPVNKKLTTIEVYNAKFTNGKLVLSTPASIIAGASVSPDVPTNLDFKVDDGKIMVSWKEPESKGGAGITPYPGATPNSPLKYELKLSSADNKLLSTIETSDLVYTFANLTNYNPIYANITSYFITIRAFYYISGDTEKKSASGEVPVNKLTIGSSSSYQGIRPGKPPADATLKLELHETGNQIKGMITPASNVTEYPVQKYLVFIDKSDEYILKASTGDNVLPSLEDPTKQVQALNDSTGLTFFINNMKYGKEVRIVVKPIADYTYAQRVNNMIQMITPKGTPVITSIKNPSGDNKSFQIDISTKGAAISALVALGREIDTSNILVQNLIGDTFKPFMYGDETNTEVANSLARISLKFEKELSSLLTILSHEFGTDIFAFPENSEFDNLLD
jgi:hypothetical protein